MVYPIKYVTNLEVRIAANFKTEDFKPDSFAARFFSDCSFLEGDTLTDAQRLAFWQIVTLNRAKLPPDLLEIVEQTAIIMQAQSKLLSKEIDSFAKNLNYKLQTPFRIEEFHLPD